MCFSVRLLEAFLLRPDDANNTDNISIASSSFFRIQHEQEPTDGIALVYSASFSFVGHWFDGDELYCT